MKLKKGNMAMLLGFVLMLSLFFATTISFMFNNKAGESRSTFIDYINKKAMEMQSQIEGYSKNEQFLFMTRNGRLLTKYEADAIVDNLKKEINKSIVLAFADPDITAIPDDCPKLFNIFSLDSINPDGTSNDVVVEIVEDNQNAREGTAYVKITVKYYSSLRAPFADGEQDKDTGEIILATEGTTGGRFKTYYNDSASRAIENPRRYKGIIKN